MSIIFNSLNIPKDLPYEVRTARFIEYFEAYLADSLNEIDESVRPYAIESALAGGKRLRPLLAFHFAGQNDKLQNSIIKASVILELVHLATLIHDDILDDADIRRNLPSMHKKIGSHVAVLLGDALFGYALELASQFPTTRVCAVVAEATRRTCSGEIRQTFSRGQYDISLDEYTGFINDKTGELFKASCELGTYLSGGDEQTVQVAGMFGLSLGINYQVFDDLIDSFESQGNSDKSLGSDWGTGKMTLPLILLRNAASLDERALIDKVFCGKSALSLADQRSKICELFEKYNTLQESVTYLQKSFQSTQSIIEEFSCNSLKIDLTNFLQSFTSKFSRISNLKTSNFLAV